ncbi:DUF5712 family protein [Bacteroides fragilis]|jgi:hypothetical protein|uniref:DUF5712 family protein n=1 Tax=Bacteroides fragilis TaxID=817 RepID=UPI002030055D|nr:DUF5712 family protein [Bacteroides fragilis]MCM0247377.1 clindamycin resistance transfer factor BtgB [Bacteroides fragilis]MCM0257414.1 clindamycin resistance transfer factor BtgB [Bacteroides fragilis]
MNIDFPAPSNGTYNNAGSSRKLCNYCEHEDMERMEQGIYTEGFFNLTDDNIYKSQVIKDIDSNIGQLLKTDAKFYAIHVSPSEKELRAMGATEQEQAEAMKRYIREVVIPEYAKNFNKGLSAEDIKFYGKIHFSRDRSDNELNMHCHLIVSRKDQTNKKKLSPLTNHKNTQEGTVKGGFDRKNLFQQTEQGFDKLFGYNRQLSETFEYCNTMKNGSITDKLRMQEQQLNAPKQDFAGEKKKEKKDLQIGRYTDKQADMIESKFANKQDSNSPDLGLSSVFSILPSASDVNPMDEQQLTKPKKKKKRGRKI